jgi:hypothetical protein
MGLIQWVHGVIVIGTVSMSSQEWNELVHYSIRMLHGAHSFSVYDHRYPLLSQERNEQKKTHTQLQTMLKFHGQYMHYLERLIGPTFN